MSDAQKQHAAVVERLIPRLAALRIELCPCFMSESYFWKVYFVLLHSRLNKEDAGVLSTSQVSYMGFCFKLSCRTCNHLHYAFCNLLEDVDEVILKCFTVIL